VEAGTGVGSLAGCVCVEGYQGSPYEGNACRPCERGWWKSWSGKGACIPCPANATSLAAATAPDQCFCMAGFERAASTPAASAPASELRCKACPPGKYQGEAAVSDGACTSCEAGTYQDEPGATACKSCQERSFMPASGATACAHCPAPEQWSPAASTSVAACMCPAGREGPPGACYCTHCLPGKYKGELDGQQTCIACAPGSFSNASGATACAACPHHTFHNEAGATACKLCPEPSHHQTKSTGSSSARDCLCAPGFELPLLARVGDTCAACAVGAEKPLIGSHPCSACLPGTYTSAPASASCQPCPSGTYQPAARQSACLACPASFHGSVPGASTLEGCVCGRGLRPRYLELPENATGPVPTLLLAPAASVVRVASAVSASLVEGGGERGRGGGRGAGGEGWG